MNKKGFTLIELLAVILILGIIALIAIPTVNNILKEARRGSFNSTLTNLEKAVEEKCTLEQIKNIPITTTYTIIDGVISPSLDIKGDLPNGTIEVNSNCEVSFTLSDKNFTGTKDFVGDITITDGSSNTEVVYKEAILNGTDPVISGDLIPVTIANDGTVKKADLKTKWYSYNEKLWANAVILTDTGKVESDGSILEESIESYFVWIPRYKYKLFDMGNYSSYIEGTPSGSNIKNIEIVFENKNTPISTGTAVGQYHSHPAFQAFNTNGLWVAKFETTGEAGNITVKPNLKPIGFINFKNMFTNSYNYNRNNDSHMMKNTEWGAVAYLSYSIYGINKKININNCTGDGLKTGYSAVSMNTEGNDSSVTQPYNTEIGYKASTTGNITGIYDMVGGAYEHMASYKENGYNGGTVFSGFDTDPSVTYGSKYFDVYPSNSTKSSFNNRILGDATGELGPFYYYSENHYFFGEIYNNNWDSAFSNFITSDEPLLLRGGSVHDRNIASQLAFASSNGVIANNFAFRVVLIG